jgi:hypothetical protein
MGRNLKPNFFIELRPKIICSHVKIIQDIQLSSHVPSLKKALEIVIYQAKALLTDNNAPANAFFLGMQHSLLLHIRNVTHLICYASRCIEA